MIISKASFEPFLVNVFLYPPHHDHWHDDDHHRHRANDDDRHCYHDDDDDKGEATLNACNSGLDG